MRLTVPPGKRCILMHFVKANASETGAKCKTERIFKWLNARKKGKLLLVTIFTASTGAVRLYKDARRAISGRQGATKSFCFLQFLIKMELMSHKCPCKLLIFQAVFYAMLFFLYIILHPFAHLTTTDSKPICQRQIVANHSSAVDIRFRDRSWEVRNRYRSVAPAVCNLDKRNTFQDYCGPGGKQDKKRNKE